MSHSAEQPLLHLLPMAQAMCKKSLEMVALKVYHMQNLCELNHYQVFREIRVHSSLQHQNIIHLIAAFQVRRTCWRRGYTGPGLRLYWEGVG